MYVHGDPVAWDNSDLPNRRASMIDGRGEICVRKFVNGGVHKTMEKKKEEDVEEDREEDEEEDERTEADDEEVEAGDDPLICDSATSYPTGYVV